MGKVIWLLLAFAVSGCESIKSALPLSNSKSSALVATCDGTRLDWTYCYDAAAKLCTSGYIVSDRRETSDSEMLAYRTQVSRTMYFRCK